MASSSSEVKSKKSRLRISLRWLLVLVLLIQLPLIYVYYVRDRIAREERAIALLTKPKGKAERGGGPLTNKEGQGIPYSKAPSQKLFAEVGLEKELYPVTRLRLQNRELDHRLEDTLAEVPALELLTFSQCTFTPEARLPSPGLQQLQILSFSRLRLTPVMLQSIGSQNGVVYLRLSHCELPGSPGPYGPPPAEGDPEAQSRDWAYLAGLEKLDSLAVTGQNYIGAMIPHLPRNLRRLEIRFCHIGNLPALSDDARLSLEEVDLSATDITEQQLHSLLHHCPRLKDVGYLDWSEDACSRLKEKFPFVRFER